MTKGLCDKYKSQTGEKKVRKREDDDEKVDKSNDPRNSLADSKTLEFLVRLLTIPMEKLSILVLKLGEFTALMDLLPNDQQKQVAIQICRTIVSSHIYLVSERICMNIIRFIHPLFSLVDVQEEELVYLSKVLHFVESGSPLTNIRLLKLFEAQFSRADRQHLKILYPVLLNRFLYTVHKANKIRSFLKSYEPHHKEQEEHPHEEEPRVDELNVLASEYAHGELENQQLLTPKIDHDSKTEWHSVLVQKFCRFQKAPYLDESELTGFRFSPETDLAIDLDNLLEFIHMITKEIEVEQPMISLQIWLELIVQIDMLSPEVSQELLYNCSTHIFTLFENEIGNSKNRLFYFNKIYGYFANLRHSSPEMLEQLYGQLRGSIALLLRREDQARAVLQLSVLYSTNQQTEMKIFECVQKSLEFVQKSMKHEKRGGSVLALILDYLLFFVSKSFQAFSASTIEACLVYIHQSIDGIDRSTEEGRALEKSIKDHMGRVIGYWKVHSDSEETKALLEKG
jgi:hypothetical protein